MNILLYIMNILHNINIKNNQKKNIYLTVLIINKLVFIKCMFDINKLSVFDLIKLILNNNRALLK